jgi:hypothetical protein
LGDYETVLPWRDGSSIEYMTVRNFIELYNTKTEFCSMLIKENQDMKRTQDESQANIMLELVSFQLFKQMAKIDFNIKMNK